MCMPSLPSLFGVKIGRKGAYSSVLLKNLLTEQAKPEKKMQNKLLKFLIECDGNGHVLVSNPCLLNILCSAFVTSQNQVVLNIDCEKDVKVLILTKNEESEQVLLKSFSSGEIFRSLFVINECFNDISILGLKLVEIGFLLDIGDKDFESIKSEVDIFLTKNTTYSACSQLWLCPYFATIDSANLITETLNQFAVDELLKNISSCSLDPCTSSSADTKPGCSNAASPSSSKFLMKEVMSNETNNNILPNNIPKGNAPSLEQPSESLQLRDYQQELASPGLEGKNCIILAPTGSGKTIVAAEICKNFVSTNDPRCILFLVPRVHLVSQQSKVLKRFVSNLFQISGESSSSLPASVAIKQHHVTVMTAEILFNLLKCSDISFDHIGLIIFDECHNTMKKHVYNKIMHLYMKQRHTHHSSKLPQIVGLSASLGVGKAKIPERAELHIKTLMANLDVTLAPIQVVQFIDSLRRFQNSNGEERKEVERHCDDKFADDIKSILDDLEKIYQECLDKFYNVIDHDLIPPMAGSHGSQEYQGWTVHLYEYSKKMTNENASRWLMNVALHLRRYNDGLIMNDHVRSSDVKHYFETCLEEERAENDVIERLKTVYIRHSPQPTIKKNPLLEALYSVLISQYSRKPESRSIIFVKTREIAKAVLTYINDAPGLSSFNLKSLPMTGTHAKSTQFGMTKSFQDNALKTFREGKSKVLVATSVAEEGLDIEQCNLVITYNYSTNEIGKVQRKGRGRAKDSRLVILAYEDSGHFEREEANECRISLSDQALLRISERDPDQLKSEVIQLQVKAIEERECSPVQLPSTTNDHEVYSLLCVGCKKLITTSNNIRQINKQHHLVVDPEFKNRTRVNTWHPGKQITDDIVLTGKHWCKHSDCRTHWGPCMTYKKISIFVLKVSSFVLVKKNEAPKAFKKWSEVPFYSVISELDPASFHYLINDDVSDDDDDDELSFDQDYIDELLKHGT